MTTRSGVREDSSPNAVSVSSSSPSARDHHDGNRGEQRLGEHAVPTPTHHEVGVAEHLVLTTESVDHVRRPGECHRFRRRRNER